MSSHRLSQVENPLDQADPLDKPKIMDNNTILDPKKTIYIRPFANPSSSVSGSWAAPGKDDSRNLNEIKPRWVIMHDADLGFVRRLEV